MLAGSQGIVACLDRHVGGIQVLLAVLADSPSPIFISISTSNDLVIGYHLFLLALVCLSFLPTLVRMPQVSSWIYAVPQPLLQHLSLRKTTLLFPVPQQDSLCQNATAVLRFACSRWNVCLPSILVNILLFQRKSACLVDEDVASTCSITYKVYFKHTTSSRYKCDLDKKSVN